MYKPLYILLCLIGFCCETKSQSTIEYITNGSFEQIDSCYGNYAPIGLDVFEWSGCTGWSNPIKSSSDLWCENPKMGIMTPPFIPGVGYQNPRTGQNYAGTYIGFSSYANYREYIQNKLTQTLKKNKTFIVEFYLSSGRLPCTTNSFGIKFFNSKYNDATTYWLTNLTPDAQNDKSNFITDTLGWQKVSLTYKANGTENYMVIGCFADSSKISISNDCDTSGFGPYIPGIGYFFIDDVSIVEKQMPDLPNVFSPNADGINDLWMAEFDEEVSCIIYNRWGNKIFGQQHKKILLWDGQTTSGEACCDGVYFYTIQSPQYNYKGYIQLVR